ncbi:MAG TPA: hypothetical protein VIK61_12330 [Acidimicrobiia bacterium]
MQSVRVPDSLSDDPPSDAPDDLKPLWPLVQQWGLGDDVDRGTLVETASNEALQTLVTAVEPALSAIDAYLDATGDAQHAVPYGDLAQATIEARFELSRRS